MNTELLDNFDKFETPDTTRFKELETIGKEHLPIGAFYLYSNNGSARVVQVRQVIVVGDGDYLYKGKTLWSSESLEAGNGQLRNSTLRHTTLKDNRKYYRLYTPVPKPTKTPEPELTVDSYVVANKLREERGRKNAERLERNAVNIEALLLEQKRTNELLVILTDLVQKAWG